MDGNITQIMDGNGKKISYVYDDLGQLTRENNEVLEKAFVYTYDNAGNRTSKVTYAYSNGTTGAQISSETYNYYTGWGDQLKEIKTNGVVTAEFTYDEIGNPETFKGYELTWHGRQLKEMGKTNSVIQFLYNADGIRTSKTVNNVEHVYTLNGSQIVSEAWGGNLLIYLYDESGSPIGMQYRNTGYAANTFNTFYFEKNLQGDVVAVYTENGVKVLSYIYDAWGNQTVTWHNSYGSNIYATYNPFRYRGYYYDTETGLYYLQSRYYNPQWGRFLNADGSVNANGDLIGFNMYAYCSNNPVMFTDPAGQRLRANITQACFEVGAAYNDERYERVLSWAQQNSVQLYSSEMEAAQAWADQYRPLSKEREHVAYIYGVVVIRDSTVQTLYYLSETLCGTKNNVILQVFALRIKGCPFNYESVSMIHSHPDSGEIYHNDFPSMTYTWKIGSQKILETTGGDKLAMEFFGYQNMYIVPYDCCDDTPSIVSYTDRSTWCPRHPYQ